MNDGDERNNPSDGRQNNLIAQTLVALVQAIGNIQPALANTSGE